MKYNQRNYVKSVVRLFKNCWFDDWKSHKLLHKKLSENNSSQELSAMLDSRFIFS